jgi:cytochrome c-type biogenesis protein CcmH/NrfG
VGERNPAEAAGLARRAAAQRPDDERYAWTLAFYQARAGDLAGAQATLEALLRANPDDEPAQRLLAEVEARRRVAPRRRRGRRGRGRAGPG